MGSSLPPDPTRIISKRIVLSGHPLKIHKKTATIRYMFFNREDVEYYRSVELHTKYGHVGHISEPLGTHGYFKAHFDGPIGQMDTICMSLYKRQFPKVSLGVVRLPGMRLTISGRRTSSRSDRRLPVARRRSMADRMR
jgi:pre-rRNA-processing protein TSR1